MIKKILIGLLFSIVLVGQLYAQEKNSKVLTTYVKTLKTDKILVKLDKETLKGLKKITDLTIHLDETTQIKFKVKKAKKRKNGSIVWRGKNKKQKAKLSLTYKKGILNGKIRIGKELYKIKKRGKKSLKYIVFKVDQSKKIKFDNCTVNPVFTKMKKLTPKEEPNISTTSTAPQEPTIQQPLLEESQILTQGDIVNGKTQIDVIILYTPDFMNHYGDGTDARIQYLIEEANEGFENSQIDVVLNLVYSRLFIEGSVIEGNNINTALDNLRNNTSVKALKRMYKADIITLMRRYDGSAGSCGLAFLLNQLSSSYAQRIAYNIVEDKQADEGGYYCSDLTYAHEVGHNFGLAHDRDHSSNSGIFDYSHGHDVAGEFATIMSYDSPEITYFSNPLVNYNGIPTGVPEGDPNSADAAKTIEQTKQYIDNQFQEELENGDATNNYTLQGILSDVDDRDKFSVYLNGSVTFTNTSSYFINIYDEEGFLVTVGGAYNDLTYTFTNSKYDVILSLVNDDTRQYYDLTNKSYSLNYTMQKPVAVAGEDITVNEGTTVTLNGSSSFDMDGNISSYEWKEGSSILSNQMIFTKSDFSVGEHTITLKVIDDQANSATDKIIVTVNMIDTDSDGISDSIDNCPLNANPDQLNTDGDTQGNVCDSDDDNDGIADTIDSDPLNNLLCGDSDNDGCEDCINGTSDTNNDGIDTDGNGICNVGDSDDDGDFVLDLNDSDPLNKFACSDSDSDGCEDCTSGTFNLSNDGIDTDGNGICNIGDTDDDGDGMPDSYEGTNGLNSLVDDGDDDLDNDGVTNFGEYRDGTDPDNATSKYFYVTLKEGWNLVALELNSSVATSSLEVHGTVELIRALKNGQWYSWIKNNSNHSDQALTEIEDGYGYWVKASQDGFIKVKGNGLANTLTITPNQWNMLGSREISDINQFFTDNPDVKMIWKYKDGKYHVISSDSNIDSDLTPLETNGDVMELQSIEKNEGFFVK